MNDQIIDILDRHQLPCRPVLRIHRSESNDALDVEAEVESRSSIIGIACDAIEGRRMRH